MLMTLNLFSSFLPQIQQHLLRSQHVWRTYHHGWNSFPAKLNSWSFLMIHLQVRILRNLISHDNVISPLAIAPNLVVTMDNQLSFSSQVATVTFSGGFRPFLSTLGCSGTCSFRLYYCNSLLAGLSMNQAIRPSQLIKNAVAWLVFNHLIIVTGCYYRNDNVLYRVH